MVKIYTIGKNKDIGLGIAKDIIIEALNKVIDRGYYSGQEELDKNLEKIALEAIRKIKW